MEGQQVKTAPQSFQSDESSTCPLYMADCPHSGTVPGYAKHLVCKDQLTASWIIVVGRHVTKWTLTPDGAVDVIYAFDCHPNGMA